MLKSIIIGKKIREARNKKNLSQVQLAKKIFISSQAVGKWERGESLPDIITLNLLAEILGVDLNYFSVSFQTVATEIASLDSLDKQSTELLSAKQNLTADKTEKKLGWNMSKGNWMDADFSGLKNLHEKFSSSNMQRCLFISSEMSGLLLKNNNINHCDFSVSDLSKSQIQSSNFLNNQFRNCNLKETEFLMSYIMGCDFTGSDFTGALFKSGGIQNNPMSNAMLKNTSFKSMHIVEIVFDGLLEDCSFENCAFRKVKFQDTTLINTFFKNNKKLKQVQFINCKADALTYAFLKNDQADLSGITLLTT